MNVAQFFSRTDKSVISNWFWTVDKGALVSIFALIVYGLILVATASPSVVPAASTALR